MLPRWARLSATVTRHGSKTSRGATVQDWSNVTTHEVAGCFLDAPSSSADYGEPEAPITQRKTLYAPPSADIKKGDRVAVGGATYQVDGVPMAYESPFHTVDYLQVQLIEWEA